MNCQHARYRLALGAGEGAPDDFFKPSGSVILGLGQQVPVLVR